MDITMPQLGETVTEGTITRWLKQVGDTVALDEPLFEVSTDKVDSEVPAPAAGVLTEILVPEGDTVEVGARLAVLGDAGRRRRAGRRAAGRRAAPPSPPRRARARAGTAGRGPARSAARAAPPRLRPHRPPRRRLRAAGSARRRRRGVRRRTVGSTSPRRAPADRRARARPGAITGTGEGGRITRSDVLERRAVGRGTRGRAPRRRPRRSPRRPRSRAGRAGRAARCATATRSSRSTTSAAAPPSTWSRSKADERARVHVGRGRLRARRARPAREPGRVEGRRRASRSPTCRSSCARSATPCATSRT